MITLVISSNNFTTFETYGSLYIYVMNSSCYPVNVICNFESSREDCVMWVGDPDVSPLQWEVSSVLWCIIPRDVLNRAFTFTLILPHSVWLSPKIMVQHNSPESVFSHSWQNITILSPKDATVHFVRLKTLLSK